MYLAFGPLVVKLKYAYQRYPGGPFVYQRVVPTDLLTRYPSDKVKKDLKTADIVAAARMVEALNRRFEAEWAGLRASPESSPKAVQAHADALLRDFGLQPGDTQSPSADAFFDRLDQKRMQLARGDDEAYGELAPAEFMSPVELAAFRKLREEDQPLLSDALELHLSLHPKKANASFVSYQRRAFASLLSVTGDMAVSSFTRDHARQFITASLERGNKTTTVRRLMGGMRAVFTTWRLERNKDLANPFERLAIPNEGEDSAARAPYDAVQLAHIFNACKKVDDDLRWLLAMLIDTGARLAEITGLAMSDVVLNAPVPYIRIQPHPWRTLKNRESNRVVPLVGASLWGAKRLVESATPRQQFAFGRYTDELSCRATAASGALNGWVKRQGIPRVVHELRHSMADRLRHIGCPKDVRYAIDGHAAQDVGDQYGKGHSLEVMHSWLKQVELKDD